LLKGTIEQLVHTEEGRAPGEVHQWLYVEMTIRNEGAPSIVEGYNLTIESNGKQTTVLPMAILGIGLRCDAKAGQAKTTRPGTYRGEPFSLSFGECGNFWAGF
jgi:hypothetical protein